MMNPLRNYIENCIDAFIVNTLEPVTADYAKRIELLEIQQKYCISRTERNGKKIIQLECDEHYYELKDETDSECLVECAKCGKQYIMLLDEWSDIELARALDEVERLGGEVGR